MNNRAIALVGFDFGARAAIMPLEALDGFELIDINQLSQNENYDLFLFARYDGIVIGTSDSHLGREVESKIVRVANEIGIPVIAVEDYPGNYRPTEYARADVLIVESNFARDLVLNRWPQARPNIWVCSSIRYDALRQRSELLRQYVNKRWRSDSSRWALWAGQPETSDGLETLNRFLPTLADRDVKLLFKAHPRDTGYFTGVYHDLLVHAGIDFVDITASGLDIAFEYAPTIILTQFSSVAVEAGFYGIPSVNILYPDIGGKRLLENKGFDIPPWTQQGASFAVTDVAEQAEVLNVALNDKVARASSLIQFDIYFATSDLVGPALTMRIKDYVRNL